MIILSFQILFYWNVGALDNPENESSSGSALAITAFVIAFGAVILRVGGRTALVSTLGLDFAQENPELQTQLDSFLAYTNGLPIGLELLFFTLAWTAVKVFCFDAGGIVLALSAGLLFGGVFQGAVASAAAATIASSVAFGLAKIDSPVRKKALEVLEEYPSLRGIEKVGSYYSHVLVSFVFEFIYSTNIYFYAKIGSCKRWCQSNINVAPSPSITYSYWIVSN